MLCYVMLCYVMTFINPGKEYWPSRGSNQRPLVLKSSTLTNELWGLESLIDAKLKSATGKKRISFSGIHHKKLSLTFTVLNRRQMPSGFFYPLYYIHYIHVFSLSMFTQPTHFRVILHSI